MLRQALYQNQRHVFLGLPDPRSPSLNGMSEHEILEEYPQLTHEDFLAALAYGAEVARERIIPVPTETSA